MPTGVRAGDPARKDSPSHREGNKVLEYTESVSVSCARIRAGAKLSKTAAQDRSLIVKV